MQLDPLEREGYVKLAEARESLGSYVRLYRGLRALECIPSGDLRCAHSLRCSNNVYRL